MLLNFNQMVAKAQALGQVTLSVAVAQDKEVLQAVKQARDAGLCQAILVGDAKLIAPMLEEVGLPADTPVIDESDTKLAALKAVSQVSGGRAQVLMKGLINSGEFLKAIVDKEVGLRTGRLLSHLSAYEIPNGDKLIFLSDSGMNIAPNLGEKKDILTNAVLALISIGIDEPKVAVLAANEIVNPKMPATVDAKALADLNRQGEFAPALVEGPISMDVALSREAAAHKGIQSQVSGDVDLLLCPTVEAGNILSKGLIHYAGFKNAGIILGATQPAVMVSRADSAESKLNSIALACLVADRSKM